MSDSLLNANILSHLKKTNRVIKNSIYRIYKKCILRFEVDKYLLQKIDRSKKLRQMKVRFFRLN